MDSYKFPVHNSKPLLESEKDIIFNLESLSVQFLRLQNSLTEIEKLFSPNLSQNDYSQGVDQLTTQQEKHNNYSSLYLKCKKIFPSLKNSSNEDLEKFDKYTSKIDNLIKPIKSKLSELEFKSQQIKSRYNFDDMAYIPPVSTDNSVLSLDQNLIESEVIEQKDYLAQRKKDLDQVKM